MLCVQCTWAQGLPTPGAAAGAGVTKGVQSLVGEALSTGLLQQDRCYNQRRELYLDCQEGLTEREHLT